ncbi:MAG: hypothetical protein K9W44_07890 [Candidatus Lokiarchaeota archaeon]|nr:hypothetical protein [Candidatus Harpocratesius repetitus]
MAVLVTNQVATQMKGTFSADDAIGGNIVAHGCHFRIQFKTKGFSANQSLERTAIIVDAPDLPPESCSFFITEAGISDSETVVYPDEKSMKKKGKGNKKDEFSFETADNVEESESDNKNIENLPTDPLAAVEKALADSENKLKGAGAKKKKKITVKKKKSTKKKLLDDQINLF